MQGQDGYLLIIKAVGCNLTDFWAAYAAVIPKEQHTAVGKETGETAHVER
jgi:IS1 family transposase